MWNLLKRKSLQEQKEDAIKEKEKFSKDLDDLKTIRLAAETKEKVRREKAKIKELRSAPTREFISNAKDAFQKAKKRAEKNKKKSVFLSSPNKGVFR